jgi:serpin B
MLIVLPRAKDGLPALERSWAAANRYPQAIDSLHSAGTVIVSLPRFKVEAEFRLKPVLSDMGAQLAFSDDADFGGIATEPLKIAEVVHKAFVEVNEEGTEAAAATGVVMAKCLAVASEPKLFQADHPFLFLIRDRHTNAVLFCGRVQEPK